MIARVVETIRRLDAETPLIVSFDAPWGEYLRKTPLAYAPIHIADHLVRSGLPIAASSAWKLKSATRAKVRISATHSS